MNISSVNFGSNSSDQSFFNGTGVDNRLNIVSLFLTTLWIIPVNSYVIWLIVTGTGNGLAAEFFSLNLSICEMIYSVESFLFFLTFQFDFLWISVYVLDGVTSTGRPLFQCLICVERYLAVVHPVTFLKFKPIRYRLFCSVFVWMASFATCGISGATFIFFLTMWYLVFLCVQFVIFLLPQLFCCVTVLRALKQSGPGDREKEEENHMKRRAFYLVLISTLSMITIYVPYVILLVVNSMLPQQRGILLSFTCVFFALAGLVQPLLFLYRVGKLPFIKNVSVINQYSCSIQLWKFLLN